jgi:hypothetical protein
VFPLTRIRLASGLEELSHAPMQHILATNTIPLINNLEIGSIFKDKDKEEGDSIIDLILAVVELLERDINRLVVEAREALEPVNYGIRGSRVT